MSALVTRRNVLTRLFSFGAVAATAAVMAPVAAQALTVAPVAPAAYTGPIRVVEGTDPEAVSDDGIVAVLLHRARTAPALWVNAPMLNASQRIRVEMWARQSLGAGRLFGTLTSAEAQHQFIAG
jgi:hypothetical protein